MITRPTHLEDINADLEFNGQRFVRLEVDLEHINKHKRSGYSLSEILKIVTSMIDGKYYTTAGDKNFGDERCTYYVVRCSYHGRQYRLVMCVCTDEPETIGILTLHKEK